MSPASLASLQPTLSEGSSDQRTHSSIRCHKWLLIFSNVKEDPSLSNSHNLLFWVVFWFFDKCIVAERNKRSCLPSIQYSSSGLTTLTSPVPDLVRISVSCLVFLIRWEHGVQNTYLLLKKSKKKNFSPTVPECQTKMEVLLSSVYIAKALSNTRHSLSTERWRTSHQTQHPKSIIIHKTYQSFLSVPYSHHTQTTREDTNKHLNTLKQLQTIFF